MDLGWGDDDLTVTDSVFDQAVLHGGSGYDWLLLANSQGLIYYDQFEELL